MLVGEKVYNIFIIRTIVLEHLNLLDFYLYLQIKEPYYDLPLFTFIRRE